MLHSLRMVIWILQKFLDGFKEGYALCFLLFIVCMLVLNLQMHLIFCKWHTVSVTVFTTRLHFLFYFSGCYFLVYFLFFSCCHGLVCYSDCWQWCKFKPFIFWIIVAPLCVLGYSIKEGGMFIFLLVFMLGYSSCN